MRQQRYCHYPATRYPMCRGNGHEFLDFIFCNTLSLALKQLWFQTRLSRRSSVRFQAPSQFNCTHGVVVFGLQFPIESHMLIDCQRLTACVTSNQLEFGIGQA